MLFFVFDKLDSLFLLIRNVYWDIILSVLGFLCDSVVLDFDSDSFLFLLKVKLRVVLFKLYLL